MCFDKEKLPKDFGASWEASMAWYLWRPLSVDAVDVTMAGSLRPGLGGMSVWERNWHRGPLKAAPSFPVSVCAFSPD